MSYIHNQQPKKAATINKKLGFALGSIILVIILLGVASYVYFWVLSSAQNKHYLNAIQPAYNLQRSQIASVYATFKRPLFTSSNPTTASNNQDLAYIAPIIKKALSATNTLSAKNNLNILPATEWRKPVMQTNSKYLAMQQYANDSTTFLTNYENDITYGVQFGQLVNSSQLKTFFVDMKRVDNTADANQLLAATSSASADLHSTIASLKQINAPADFRQYNGDQVKKIIAVNNAFIDIIGSIKGENAEQVISTINSLNQTANTMHVFANINIASLFKGNLLIDKEMNKLKVENPLNSSRQEL